MESWQVLSLSMLLTRSSFWPGSCEQTGTPLFFVPIWRGQPVIVHCAKKQAEPPKNLYRQQNKVSEMLTFKNNSWCLDGHASRNKHSQIKSVLDQTLKWQSPQGQEERCAVFLLALKHKYPQGFWCRIYSKVYLTFLKGHSTGISGILSEAESQVPPRCARSKPAGYQYPWRLKHTSWEALHQHTHRNQE